MGVVELQAVQIGLDGAPGVGGQQVGEVVGQLRRAFIWGQSKNARIFTLTPNFLVYATQIGTPLLTLDNALKAAAQAIGLEVLEV